MESVQMHAGVLRTALHHFQSRWVLVASLAVMSFVIGGAGSVAVSLLISPWMTEFGWPNGLTSSVATAFNLAALLAAPLVGLALDKVGPRMVMFVGALSASTGLMWASRCHTWHAMVAAFVLTGIGYCASFSVSVPVVITNWMESRKSLGMGIMLGASSTGAATFSLLIGKLSETYGWRVTIELTAALIAVMLPLILLTLHTGPLQRFPTQDSASGKAQSRPRRRELLCTRTFVIVTAGGTLFTIGMGGIYYHVVSVLVKAGYSTHSAGLVLGVSWLLSALGSLLLGALADRLGAKRVLAGALFSCALGTLFLLGASQATMGVACIVAFVIFWGASANSVGQLAPVILAERFGFQDLGMLIGVQSATMGVAGAAAPVMTGLLYDEFGDYRIAIYLSALATFGALVLVLLINARHRAGRAAT